MIKDFNYRDYLTVAIACIVTMFVVIILRIVDDSTPEVETLAQTNPVQYETDHTLPIEITTRKTLHSDDEAQYHSALSRSLNIDQSCYDSVTELWLVHSVNDEDSEWSAGWYIESHDNLETLALGNGTLVLTDTGRIFNQEIDPDISGLSCQNHTPHK